MSVLLYGVGALAALVGFILIGVAAKFALDYSPYLYASTRCSARLGMLLKRKDYDELIDSHSIKELHTILEGTYYGHLMNHVTNFKDFSQALVQDNKTTYVWLDKIAAKSMKPVISALAMRFEVQEIKHAATCIQNGQHIGELTAVQQAHLRAKLESATDMTSLIAACEGTPYHQYMAKQNPQTLFADLDSWYYTTVLEAIQAVQDRQVKQGFLSYWKTMIDAANARLAARNKTGFIQGGNIAVDQLVDTELSTCLADTIYAPFKDAGDVDVIFTSALKQLAGVTFAKHALKGGSLIRYIILKDIETRNLQVIMKLKSESLHKDLIRKYIVM